ncbi:kinesin-related protein 4-like [Teleopsis dalmanni]|uniref:kinesin-related protein 4-like n=1 Tax=Teleopsis dalmanni TaxID=139649 RepID=UPI0018CD4FA0|nr:kinesin-related protein 4-like [Teleopsis dalmanni]
MGRASKIRKKWTTKKVASSIHPTVGLNENEIRNLYEEFQPIARPRVQFVTSRSFSHVMRFMIGYSTLNSIRQQKQADEIDRSKNTQHRSTYVPVPSPFPPNFNFFRNGEHTISTEQSVNRSRQQTVSEPSYGRSEQSHLSGSNDSEIVKENSVDGSEMLQMIEMIAAVAGSAEESDDENDEESEKVEIITADTESSEESDDENENDLEMVERITVNAESAKDSDEDNKDDLEMVERITTNAESTKNSDDENKEIIGAEMEPDNISQSEVVGPHEPNEISEQLPYEAQLDLVSEEENSPEDANGHNITDEERNLQEMLLQGELQNVNDEEGQAERGQDEFVVPHLIDADINMRVLRLLEQHAHEVTTHNFFAQPPSTEHPVKSIFTKSRVYKIDEPILNIKEAEIKMRDQVEDKKECNAETELKESNAFIVSDESDEVLSTEHATDVIDEHNLQQNTEETGNPGAEDNVGSDEPQEGDNENE